MKNKGQIIFYILFYLFLTMMIFSGSLIWLQTFLGSIEREIQKIIALNIAESGIEYYRWYLNHFPKDFTDGTGQPGPYVHNFYNRRGEKIGEFILEIDPPDEGFSLVNIISEGKLKESKISKKIISLLGRPSLAKYSVLVDDNIRFGEGTVVYGEIHSNKGIRFDGLAYNLVKSSLLTYKDPDHSGCDEWAVHTHINPVDPCPPQNPDPSQLPLRSDVFKAGRLVGVPSQDFVGISQDLSNYKTLAQENGIYLGFSGVSNYGYELIIRPDGKIDAYLVKKIIKIPGCSISDPYTDPTGGERYSLSSWSISQKSFLRTYNYPRNGVIFVEDNVWVSGQINNKKILIASAKFPENSAQMTNIIVNSDLKYTNYDGRDAIGLIAQRNILIGLQSSNILRIDGALIAQKGRIGRHYYSSECGLEYKREKITIYGSLITRKRYGFSWVDNQGNWSSGYRLRELVYNADNLYFPPPYFPLASEFYEIFKWKEY
jgi:hypothetical protein